MTKQPNRRSRSRADIRAEVRARFARLAAAKEKKAAETPLAKLPAVVDKDAIALGRNQHGAPVLLPLRPRLEHMHVIGTTGGGKSNFLQHLIRQDILDGRGVCLLDPHGSARESLFKQVLAWLDHSSLLQQRVVHVVDLNHPDFSVGFNPLRPPSPDTDVSVIAADVFEGVQRAWGEGEVAGKPVIMQPTIRRLLMATFATLAELGLTLAQADLLFDPHDRRGVRRMVVEKLQDRYAATVLDDLHQMSVDDRSKRDFRAEVVGPVNRLVEFIRSPAMRTILGQTDRVIDFTGAMDNCEIILANLAGGDRVAAGDAELFARLLTHSLFRGAQRRGHPERPYVFVLDECQKLLSGDTEQLLAESRKNGIACVLAHQSLAQLGKPDDSLRVAISANTNAKLVFRLKDPKEAAELAEAIIPMPLEKPVKILVKPTVVGNRRTRFRSQSSGRNESTSASEGVSKTRNSSETVTDSEAKTVGTNWSKSKTHTVGRNSSRTVSDGWGENESTSISETTGTNSSENSSFTSGRGSSSGSSESASSGSSSSRGSSGSINVSAPAGLPGRDAAIALGRVRRDWLNRTSDLPYSLTDGSNESSAESRGRAFGRNNSTSESSASTRGSATGRSQSRSVGRSSGTSRSHSVADTEGASESHATGYSHGGSEATTTGRSVGRTVGESVGKTTTTGTSTGTSETTGFSEGLEPIYELLPTAVHSLENVRYAAAQMLRGLRTGTAFVNLVTRDGMQATLVHVPMMQTRELSAEEFADLRRRALEASPSAIPADEAARHVADRERLLIAEAEAARRPRLTHQPAQPMGEAILDADEEPETFRLRAPTRPKK